MLFFYNKLGFISKRVAQAMILPVPMVELVEADQLGESDARAKGAWL